MKGDAALNLGLFFLACSFVAGVAWVVARQKRNEHERLKLEAQQQHWLNAQRHWNRLPDGSLDHRAQLITVLQQALALTDGLMSKGLELHELAIRLSSTRNDLGGGALVLRHIEELKAQGLLKYGTIQAGRRATKYQTAQPAIRSVLMTLKGREFAQKGMLPTDPKKRQQRMANNIYINNSPGAAVGGESAYGNYVGGDSIGDGSQKVSGNRRTKASHTQPSDSDRLIKLIDQMTKHLAGMEEVVAREAALRWQQEMRDSVARNDPSALRRSYEGLRSTLMGGVLPNALWDGLKTLVLNWPLK